MQSKSKILEKLITKTSSAWKIISSPSLLKIKVQLWISLLTQRFKAAIKLAPESVHFQNSEGLSDFNFYISRSSDKEGVSVILRVKNEEQKILYCLQSVIDIFDEIVFVDNGSEDNTLRLTQEFKQQFDSEDKIKIFHYPWKIARYGSEHQATPENSVHSTAYYYNWVLSHCSFNYACKWDADMVLSKEQRDRFKALLKVDVVKGDWRQYWIGGETVYRSLSNEFFLTSDVNWEPRIFPYSYFNRYYKDIYWESLYCSSKLKSDWSLGKVFYELKFSNENEFGNYNLEEFFGSIVNSINRTKQEWENMQFIQKGDFQKQKFIQLPPSFLDEQMPPPPSTISNT